MDLEYYIDAGLENNRRLSRTFSGIVDTSVSPDKPKALSTKKDLVESNFRSAVEYSSFTREHHIMRVEEFIHDLFCILNNGIIDTNKFLRTHAIPKEKGYGFSTHVIPQEFVRFCDWYHIQMNKLPGSLDNTAACALTERTDKAHYYSDSCGRMSRLLSIVIAMRRDEPVRLHDSMKGYYDRMRSMPKRQELFNPASAKEYIDKYRALPLFKR